MILFVLVSNKRGNSSTLIQWWEKYFGKSTTTKLSKDEELIDEMREGAYPINEKGEIEYEKEEDK